MRVSICKQFTPFNFNVSLFFRRIEWKNFEATVTEQKHIKVRDVITEAKENLGI